MRQNQDTTEARPPEWCRLDRVIALPGVGLRHGLVPGALRRYCRRRYPFDISGHRLRYLPRRRTALILPARDTIREPVPALFLEHSGRRSLRRGGGWSGVLAFGTARGHDMYRLREGRIVECWTDLGTEVPSTGNPPPATPRQLARARLPHHRPRMVTATALFASLVASAAALVLALIPGDPPSSPPSAAPAAVVTDIGTDELAGALCSIAPPLRVQRLTAGSDHISVELDTRLTPAAMGALPPRMAACLNGIETDEGGSRISFSPARFEQVSARTAPPADPAAPLPERWRLAIDGRTFWEQRWALDTERAAAFLPVVGGHPGLATLDLRRTGDHWALEASGTGLAPVPLEDHADGFGRVTEPGEEAGTDLLWILRPYATRPRPVGTRPAKPSDSTEPASADQGTGSGSGWVRFSDGSSMEWMERPSIMHLEMHP